MERASIAAAASAHFRAKLKGGFPCSLKVNVRKEEFARPFCLETKAFSADAAPLPMPHDGIMDIKSAASDTRTESNDATAGITKAAK